MRLVLPLAALALVSACNKSEPAPQAATPQQQSAATTTQGTAALPAVSANARTTVDYAGAYSQVGSDGKVSTLKLNTDDTYEWSGPSGKVTKGTFAWYKDGSRILLDQAGGKAVYAIADGAVYKLADKNAPVDALSAEQMFKRGAA